AYDVKEVIEVLADENTFFEIKSLYAAELVTGLCRIEGKVAGIVANQPKVKGGVLFVESSDKAARFIQVCDAFNIPILFLADVPGFMIGSKSEREGMIRAGAKFIHAMSNASVPKLTLIIRKAFGAGLYAMCGPAFDCDSVIALPSAAIAVMGPEPAVNAVYYNKLAAMGEDERKAFLKEKMVEYEKNINIYRMASELVIDSLIDFDEARSEVAKRFDLMKTKKKSVKEHSSILPM
ncbi:acyl-CoA carboxylase subunit beta, partial [bacterium]|nr:acyl-CoA carboxylase subunit beta [bacterium]